MKKITLLLLTLSILFVFGACGNTEEAQTAEEKTDITIATTTIPAQILEVAKEDMESKGYTVEIKVFDDVFTPNIATEEGSVDANFYQYEPFLDQYNEEKGAHLVSTGRKYYDLPIGMYSEKYDRIEDLPENAKIGVYSNADTKARCLQILAQAGLLTLADVETPTIMDITENPKNIEFVDLDSDAKLTASLPDLDAAIIYKQGMVLAGKDPESSILPNITDDTYAILLVVKDGNQDTQWVKDLDAALTTDKVRDFINENFEGALQPLF